jgi:hypothetical protein
MAKSRPVTIQSYRDPTNAIKFRMFEGSVETDLLVFNKYADGMKKKDEYDIDFTLVNGEGCAVEFVTDDNSPGQPVMYLAQGSATHCPPCPTGPSTTPIKDFTAGKPTKTTLSVKNKDDDVCYYKFALRFYDTSTGKIETFDPIYGNQNGGGGGFASMIASSPDSTFSGAAGGILATLLLNPQAMVMTYVWAAVIGGIVGIAASLLLGGRAGGRAQSAPYA